MLSFMEQDSRLDNAMTTIDYYNANAQAFSSSTASVELSDMQDRFLALLPEGASILDFGCGSGRDAKYFIDHGFAVTATDGSAKLCHIASQRAGIPVRCELFGDLVDIATYDGIWACSSILHLSRTELTDVLPKMRDALKPSGVIYTSFKYGCFEGERNGRWFTDLTEESFATLLSQVEGLALEQQWITGDVRPGRGDEKWLNLILRKH